MVTAPTSRDTGPVRRRVAFVSFRLGLTDGVSVVADTWRRVFESLGWETVTVAGEGPVDRVLTGLALEADSPPHPSELADALCDVDLVVAENILTIPMNLPASRAVAAALAGRPAILHHHDPPWQRARYADVDELPPTDDAWIHVTINRLTERQFAERGIGATTIYNGFDTTPRPGDRLGTRELLGVGPDERLILHPVRAIPRKNVGAAVALAETAGATYWLPGPAEDGFAGELESILGRARCRILRATLAELDPSTTMADAYAASDLVAFPSTWEGFGNPPIEAAIHLRPVVVGSYPVADELRALGFRWIDVGDDDAIAAALASPPVGALATNRAIADRELSIPALTRRVKDLLDRAGWSR